MEIEPENVIEKVFQCTELSLHIFGYLEQSDLFKAMRVCKEFLEVTQDPSLWRKIYVTPFSAKYNTPLFV